MKKHVIQTANIGVKKPVKINDDLTVWVDENADVTAIKKKYRKYKKIKEANHPFYNERKPLTGKGENEASYSTQQAQQIEQKRQYK